jgi:hypothetical protein
MKYVDEYRDEADAQAAATPSAAARRALDADGDLRRPDAHADPVRHRPHAPRPDHAGARARLPRLRDAARDDRPRHRDRAPPDVIFTSFGDMLRVPGSDADLLAVKADGGDVRIVYSPLDASARAEEPGPGGRLLRRRLRDHRAGQRHGRAPGATQLGVRNFSMLVSHVLVPPAMEAILGAPTTACRASSPPATSAPSWATGSTSPRGALPRAHRRHRLRAARPAARHPHGRRDARGRPLGRREPVRPRGDRDGNQPAQDLVARVFRSWTGKWRGIGGIPRSGLGAAAEYARTTRSGSASEGSRPRAARSASPAPSCRG